MIIAICDMPRQEFSLCECVYIHNTYKYVISVILLLFVQMTQVLQFPVINVLEIFGGVCSNLSSISSNVRTWCSTVDFSILYGACFFESFSLSLNCTGIRHVSSWKLYLKFASCLRTRLSAFHIRIVNIHTFTQWEFLSRHVTIHNNHNHYT